MGGLWHVFTHISQIMLLYMAWSIIFMAIVIILKCTKWRYSGDTSDFRYDDYWWISQYLCVMPVVGVYWGIPNFLSPTCFFYIMALGLSHKIENYLNAWAFLCVFFWLWRSPSIWPVQWPATRIVPGHQVKVPVIFAIEVGLIHHKPTKIPNVDESNMLHYCAWFSWDGYLLGVPYD